MEIYNERMERIEAPDLTMGWLEEKVKTVYHAAKAAVEELWHYEIEAQYPNGGQDVRRVIDREGTAAQPAWEEEIPICVYHPYTEEELERIKSEAQAPSAQERLDRMEEAVAALSDRMGTMMKRITEILEMRGGA